MFISLPYIQIRASLLYSHRTHELRMLKTGQNEHFEQPLKTKDPQNQAFAGFVLR